MDILSAIEEAKRKYRRNIYFVGVPNLEWLKARPYEMRYSILNQEKLSYPPTLILKKENITLEFRCIKYTLTQ
jgi:hypothetical protein